MVQDARLYQIVFLSLFLLLGIGTRDWTLQPVMVGTAIATCLLTQTLASWVFWPVAQGTGHTQDTVPSPHSLLSPIITGLGLSLLLRTDHLITMMLAAAIAILSKFLIRINGKHLFNPTNLGIVGAIVLTQDAWISPGQWGESSWYALGFLGAGGIVLQKVGRWDTTIAFLTSYGAFEAMRNVWLGWTWDVWGHRLMSGSLLLFALFMVTDPRTIPDNRWARVLWAIAIALLAFILRNFYFISTAVFWALFALSPLTLVLDALWQAPRFKWLESAQPSEVLKTSEV
jgi:Na+-transporting NADH:ubiquinone oxidoreductase subunit NqrB